MQEENFGRPKSQWTNTHLDGLVSAIRSCGIGFQVWQTKDGTWEWTSLLGGDKKKIMRNLPPKFDGVLRPETKEVVLKLWTVRKLFCVALE